MPEQLANFRKLGTNAVREFDRLLAAGESALLHLPQQHADTMREILAKYSLMPSDGAWVEVGLSLKTEHGLWCPGAEWIVPPRFNTFPLEARQALAMLTLFRYIESGEYRKQPKEGRLVFRNELLRLWWNMLAVPELKRQGLFEHQSNAGDGNAPWPEDSEKPIPRSQVVELIRSAMSAGEPRHEAMKRIAKLTGREPSSVSEIATDDRIWAGKKGRPPKK